MLLNLYGDLVKSAKKNLNFLIIFFSLFIFGIILGAIFKSEIEKEFFYSNTLKSYIKIFDTDQSLFKNAINKLFVYFIITVIFCVTSISIWLLPIQCLLLIYHGFIFSFLICDLITIFSFSGIIVCIFIIIPVYLIRVLSLVIISLFSINNYKCKKHNFSALLQVFLIAFTLCIIACIFELFIVGCIIRPLNVIL